VREGEPEGAAHPRLLSRSILTFAGAGAALAMGLLVIAGPSGRSRGASREKPEPFAGSSISRDGTAESDRGSAAKSPDRAGTALPAGTASSGYVESPAGRAVLSDGLRVRLGAGERARLVVGAGWKPIDVSGPGLLEAWSAPTEVSGWRFAYEGAASGEAGRSGTRLLVPVWASIDPPGEPEPARAKGAVEEPVVTRAEHRPRAAAAEHGVPAAVEPAERSSDERGSPRAAIEPSPGGAVASEGAWSRAAQALDRNDFESADRALGELCADLDPKTRDAARLTRAKLWIARGRVQTVRPVLEDLAETGATALVRHDARELLDGEPGRP
jgi:hypothetical protein